MEVLKLIERIEKNKQVGRIDKKSAISYINDAMYEISKRQSLTITDRFKGLTSSPIVLTGVLIKLFRLKFGKGDFRIQVSSSGIIHVLTKKDKYGLDWELIVEDHGIEFDVDVEYCGYKPVVSFEGEGSEVLIPEPFHTAIVYYALSKTFEEVGDYDRADYFMKQYSREFIMKPSPRRDIVSKPSEYSLL